MTDLDRLTEALAEWNDPEARPLANVDGMTAILNAAMAYLQGEPLLWCETHWSGSVEGKFCQLVASTPFPEEQSCHIVSQWRCPPPEGEGK